MDKEQAERDRLQYESLVKRIENDFTYHAPTEIQRVKYEHLRSEAKALAHLINGLCSNGREKSTALSKLEEAIMWANAGIARSAVMV